MFNETIPQAISSDRTGNRTR